MEYQIEKVKKIYELLEKDFQELNIVELENKYNGKNGLLKQLLSEISTLKPEERKEFGREVNILKSFFSEKSEQLKVEVISDSISSKIDPSAPFDINIDKKNRPQSKGINGTIHPIMQEMESDYDEGIKLDN